MHLTTLDWSLCFQRNKLHIFMHIIMHMHTLHTTITNIHRCTSVHIVAAKAIQQSFILIRCIILILLTIKMFGCLLKLTPKDPKENGYQNSHLVFLMQVRALTRRERDGALVVDAHGLDGHIFDASLSRKFWSFRAQFLGLITISKTPYLFTCLSLIHI